MLDVRHSIDNMHVKKNVCQRQREEFCPFLHDLKVPSGYSSNFKTSVSEGHENEFQLDEIS
jgi:ABC-type hemin transport system ATPase subunit